MNYYLKRILLIAGIVSQLFLLNQKLWAQEPPLYIGTDDSIMVQRVLTALTYLQGNDSVEVDYGKAFPIFLDGAQQDIDFCMLMTGHMLFKGDGIDANYPEALRWLKKSANNYNNAFAMLEIGLMYKAGVLGDIDFKKMTHWFKKAANLGHSEAQYAMGYYHLKGLGVNQNYAKAFHYFNLCAEKQHPGGIFGMALCYECGLGVEADLEKATEYYRTAAAINYEQAISWLENHDVQDKSADMLPVDIQEMVTGEFKSVGAHSETINIDDKTEGFLLIYDWSGKEIDDHYPVKISRTKSGDFEFLVGENISEVSFTIEGNTIEFDGFDFTRTERINNTQWQATHAYLENREFKGENYVVADLRLYSPQLKEPGASAYLVLKSTKVSKAKLDEIEMVVQPKVEKTMLKAFPNPFTQQVTIEIQVQQTVNASLYVCDLSGRKIKTIANQQEFNEGKQQFIMQNELNRGAYLVVFDAGDQSQTLKIIKE